MRILRISKVHTFLIGLMMMTILLCCSSLVQAAPGDFTFNVTAGKAQLTQYNGTGGAVTIPSSTLDGYPVTSIGGGAFSNCTKLTSISIPQGVTSIGGGAFWNCLDLISIIIPQSVISIGGGAFENCGCLTSISIPQGVTTIGEGTFMFCGSLTSINIPQGVTSIDENAFMDCTSLTSIIIPQGVTSIGLQAFNNCTNLTSVSLPQGVTSIGSCAFYGCSGLTSIRFNSATTAIYDSAHTIPVSTTIIGYNPSTALTYAAKNDRNFELLAIPVGTVIFANGQAMNLGYANDPAHTTEVVQDVVSGGNIYVITFSGQVINNSTSAILTNLSVLPAVTYKDANGNVKHFAAGDGPEVTTSL